MTHLSKQEFSLLLELLRDEDNRLNTISLNEYEENNLQSRHRDLHNAQKKLWKLQPEELMPEDN